MASALHHAIVELLRRDPSLAPDLAMRALGQSISPPLCFEAHDGRLRAVSFVTDPREIQVDLLVVGLRGNAPELVATVEAQLGLDPTKRFRLLEYVAAARRDYETVGLQIVISPDPDVLAGISIYFEREPHFCPVLLGPDEVPKITDVEAALARPALALLSAVMHLRSTEAPQIIETVVESWTLRDDLEWHADAAFLWACIPEEVMTELDIPIQLQRFDSDLFDDDDDDPREPSNWERGTGLYQRACRAGRAEGLIAAIAAVLAARGIVGTGLERLAAHGEQALVQAVVLAGSVASVDELDALLASTPQP